MIINFITLLRPFGGKNLPKGRFLPLGPSILMNYATIFFSAYDIICLWIDYRMMGR